MLTDDDDKEKIGIVPVLQKGQDRFGQEGFDLLVDDDDKEKIVIDTVLQHRQDRFDLVVVDDKKRQGRDCIRSTKKKR